MKKRKLIRLDFDHILIWIAIILIPFIIYIYYRISISSNRLFHISVVALIAGAIIETKCLTPKWSTIFNITISSFVFSFICFVPGKREYTYIFDNHIKIWPYMFLFFFLLEAYGLHKDKIIPRMTESITLIISLCIIYWVLDHGFYNINSIPLKVIIVIGYMVAIFSIINAFVNINLSKSLRLFLSIWSSLIMILLAIDNIYIVYQNGEVEDDIFIIDQLHVGLQYFLLGICSIYILQNIMMILRFFPEKDRFFNKNYFKDIKQLKKEHIHRYSVNQSNFVVSLVCLLFSVVFFTINYIFGLFPRNTAIWLTIFVLNNIVYFYEIKKTSLKNHHT